jgi:hypothetical protein
MKKLEIGDRIYERGDSGFYSWTTVVRTTPTLAITKGGGKFKINVVDGECCEVPKEVGRFDRIKYLLGTEELRKAYQKQALARKLKEFDFSKLNLETLLEIDNILKLTIK